MRETSLLKFFIKSHGTFLILIVIYRLFTDLIYGKIIFRYYAEIYKYVNKESLFSVLTSWIIFLIFGILTIRYYYKENSPSNSLVIFLFLIQIVPYTSMIMYGNFELSYIIANTTYWVIFYFAMLLFDHTSVKTYHVICVNSDHKHLSDSDKIRTVTILFAIFIIYMVGRYSHFRINFDIDMVYLLRSEAKNYNVPTFFRYLYGWAGYVNAFLIAYNIRRKNVKISFLLGILQVFMYGYDGMKGPFFFAIFVILINCFLPKIRISSLNAVCLYSLTGLVIFIYVFNKITGSCLLAQLFTNRLGFITNQIAHAYFQFFTTHEPDYFRTSFLRYFGIKSPYTDIYGMISVWFFGLEEVANSGLLSDAMTNFGLAGIFIMPWIVAFTLKLFDNCVKDADARIQIPVAFYLFLMLTSMFYLSCILTGGLIIIGFLLKWISKDLKVREMKDKSVIKFSKQLRSI